MKFLQKIPFCPWENLKSKKKSRAGDSRENKIEQNAVFLKIQLRTYNTDLTEKLRMLKIAQFSKNYAVLTKKIAQV